MSKPKIIVILLLFCIRQSMASDWSARWISCGDAEPAPNTWLAFRKAVTVKQMPSEVIAKISADSKYWLWINGKMVVFEGGLKRGPDPDNTYYDEVNISRWLRPGRNIIGVMVWYFGKEGFSHHSSGRAGLLFDCRSAGVSVISDASWDTMFLDEYSTASPPYPNYRLAESSIRYDARKAKGNWYADTSVRMERATEFGRAGTGPWNRLVARPIPLFRNYGLKKYPGRYALKEGDVADTLICKLPYNAQITPYFRLRAPEAGMQITMFTDNYLLYNGGADYIRSEYVTREGLQEYESVGWVNGHQVYYVVPKGVKVLALGYRETGYDTGFAEPFTCSDPFFNRLCEKAVRTLYLNMRDSYMDCPDRERAQWTGDAVNQSAQSFYSLSPSSHALARKWLHEIADWQRPDGALFAPVPAGNWNKELPDQSLATIGYYGLWNYYLHTGDTETLQHVYGPAMKYLSLWQPDGQGLVAFRKGDWTWGDWGDEKDIVLIFHSFYYLAMKGMMNAARALEKGQDARALEQRMKTFKAAFNRLYWNGQAYRHPEYRGKTDDRAQALAVVSGIADRDKFDKLVLIFKKEEHASPYMEKYVMEALFRMGEADLALERHKKRFSEMVDHPVFTTLWEGWNFNDPVYGGGTINHSWSGGALSVLPQYLCGISPLEPGYKLFRIMPQPGTMQYAAATVSSVAGEIKTSFTNTKNKLTVEAVVPVHSEAVICVPPGYDSVWLNGKKIAGSAVLKDTFLPDEDDGAALLNVKVAKGRWKLVALKTN